MFIQGWVMGGLAWFRKTKQDEMYEVFVGTCPRAAGQRSKDLGPCPLAWDLDASRLGLDVNGIWLGKQAKSNECARWWSSLGFQGVCGPGWFQSKSIQFNWTQINSDQLTFNSTQFNNWIDLHWIQLNPGLNWIGSIGIKWIGLNWTELDWTDMNWTAPNWNEIKWS